MQEVINSPSEGDRSAGGLNFKPGSFGLGPDASKLDQSSRDNSPMMSMKNQISRLNPSAGEQSGKKFSIKVDQKQMANVDELTEQTSQPGFGLEIDTAGEKLNKQETQKGLDGVGENSVVTDNRSPPKNDLPAKLSAEKLPPVIPEETLTPKRGADGKD